MGDAPVANHMTSILLPEARVVMYAKEQSSLDAALGLRDDWRFARVSVQAEQGDVETAIAAYADYASPELLIIQTETIDESFTQQLEALAEHCDEWTSAIIIGPENDVNLYRRLIDMGVSDYLVRPIESDVLSEVVAKALIEKKGVGGSNLVAVIGAKGGVGTSLISATLAHVASDILNQKTTLLDTACGWSTLGVVLGFEPVTSLAEAVKAAENSKEDDLNRMFHQVNDNLNVLATGGDALLDATVNAAQLEDLLDMVMVKSPLVIADLSNSNEILQKIVLARANHVIVLSTPTLSSLRLSRSLLQEIQDVRGGEESSLHLLINMQGIAPSHEVSEADIKVAVGKDVAGSLPFLPKAFIGAESESKALTLDKDARGIIDKKLVPLLGEILSLSPQDGSVKQKSDGFLSGLLRR